MDQHKSGKNANGPGQAHSQVSLGDTGKTLQSIVYSHHKSWEQGRGISLGFSLDHIVNQDMEMLRWWRSYLRGFSRGHRQKAIPVKFQAEVRVQVWSGHKEGRRKVRKHNIRSVISRVLPACYCSYIWTASSPLVVIWSPGRSDKSGLGHDAPQDFQYCVFRTCWSSELAGNGPQNWLILRTSEAAVLKLFSEVQSVYWKCVYSSVNFQSEHIRVTTTQLRRTWSTP